MYYDRNGNPMTLEEWAIASSSTRSIQRTMLKGPARGTKWVSTVWLGLDHQFCSGPLLIFETMAFTRYGDDLCQERYSTQEEARAGHTAVCSFWQHNRATRRKMTRNT